MVPPTDSPHWAKCTCNRPSPLVTGPERDPIQRLDLSGPRHARDSGLPRPSSIASTVRYTAFAPDPSRGSGGTEGPTRGQNKKGACRTKLHRERRRRWRLGWSRRGSASAVSWSLPRARARRVRFGPPDRLSPLGEVYLQPTLTTGHWTGEGGAGREGGEDGLGTRQV